jgi:hypothetical protein
MIKYALIFRIDWADLDEIYTRMVKSLWIPYTTKHYFVQLLHIIITKTFRK